MIKSSGMIIKSQGVKNGKIEPWDIIQATYMGENHTRIKKFLRKTEAHVKFLPGKRYQILSTGEIKDMAVGGEKNKLWLRSVFRNLQDLIRTNFSAREESQIFLTLTYAENMKDFEQAGMDWKNFMKKLRRELKGHKLDYIVVYEPQARGAWHMHAMIKTDQRELWVGKKRIKEIWGHGNAYIERLKSDDVGAYYVTYFNSLSEDVTFARDNEEREDFESEEELMPRLMREKARIKGSRLHFYPKNMRFYRCSRGISRPNREEMLRLGAIPENQECAYVRTVEIFGEKGDVVQRIQTEHYKKL